MTPPLSPESLKKLISIGNLEIQIPCAICNNKIRIVLAWKHITDDDPTNFKWGTDDEFACMPKGETGRVLVHNECLIKESEK